MDLTQRLTQEICQPRVCPEQIGYLGICGNMHPVKVGPNKIGRDPQMCDIVIDMKSLSRQHAVINVLNASEYMLMDLGSSNKTKLGLKTLPPYLPHPLQNGDTVQFGEVFGVFRLLKDDTDLPMTQQVDIPDTPVFTRHVSRTIQHTIVPESPDISDREESYIVSSQPSAKKDIKTYVKAPTKQPAGNIRKMSKERVSNNDSIFWNASSRSPSLKFNVDDTDSSINESTVKPASIDSNERENIRRTSDPVDIHELETQIPGSAPSLKDNESIHTIDTQIPISILPSIHNMDTQVPGDDNVPLSSVKMLNVSEDMQLEVCKDDNIYEAQTQILPKSDLINLENNNSAIDKTESILKENPTQMSESDEEIILDDFESQGFEEDSSYSQVLIKPETNILEQAPINQEPCGVYNPPGVNKINIKTLNLKPCVINDSDSSTDCDDVDILPTQILPRIENNEDDLTDCEEDVESPIKTLVNIHEEATQILIHELVTEFKQAESEVDLVDAPTQIINHDESIPQRLIEDIADCPTQIIDKIDTNKCALTDQENDDINTTKKKGNKGATFDEALNVASTNTSINRSSSTRSPFKVPSLAALKSRKSKSRSSSELNPPLNVVNASTDRTCITNNDILSRISPNNINSSEKLDQKKDEIDVMAHYNCTQDVLSDLLSQQEETNDSKMCEEDVILPSSQEEYVERLSATTKSKSPIKSSKISSIKKSSDKNISPNQLSELASVIGVNSGNLIVHSSKDYKTPEKDHSDLEETPKKVSIKLCDVELPNSQEIRSVVSSKSEPVFLYSSSDSDTETNSEDLVTPILFAKKSRVKKENKLDLSKRSNVENLPTRVITRVRKPNKKFSDFDIVSNNNILRSKLFPEQEENINNDIVKENIARLKAIKHKKSKSTKPEIAHEVECKAKNINNAIKVSSRKHDSDNNNQKNQSPQNKEHLNIKNKEKTSKVTAKSNNSTTKVNETVEEQKNKSNEQTKVKDKDSSESSKSTRSSNRIISSTTGSIKKSYCDSTLSETTAIIDTVRRSKRQNNDNGTQHKHNRKSKHKDEIKEESTKQKKEKSTKKETIKLSHSSVTENVDQSKVYGITDKSHSDSSCTELQHSGKRTRKRLADTVVESVNLTPKRSKSSKDSSPLSVRSTPTRTNVRPKHVLFTAFADEKMKIVIERLGAHMVSGAPECSVLVTQQIKRTFKLLCAIGLGKPIVGPSWLQACQDSNMLVDPWLHLLRDDAAEKRFKFNLESTLKGPRNFLSGFNVSSTPSVMPSKQEMKLIVECSGGVWKEGGTSWLCISCGSDRALWPALKKRGAILVTSELILGGVLRQILDIQGNRIP